MDEDRKKQLEDRKKQLIDNIDEALIKFMLAVLIALIIKFLFF